MQKPTTLVLIGIISLILFSGCPKDNQPPQIVEFTVSPQTVNVNDTISVYVVATDNAGLKGIALGVDGQQFPHNCSRKKSCERDWTGTPADLGLEPGTLTISVRVVDLADNETTDQKTITILSAGAETCSELGGDICTSDESCQGSWLSVSDTTRCCSAQCIISAGESCSNLGSYICEIDDICPGSWLTANDTSRCCSQQCVAALTCSQLGGDICTSNEVCGGNWLTTSDTTRCCSVQCSEIPQKTCSELGGDICTSNESCQGSWLTANDTSRCCSQQCVAAPADTCSDLGGYICTSNEVCNGDWHDASDTDWCCSQECEEGGSLIDQLLDSLLGFGGLIEDTFSANEPELLNNEPPILGGGGLQ